jgi:hypothetical protein
VKLIVARARPPARRDVVRTASRDARRGDRIVVLWAVAHACVVSAKGRRRLLVTALTARLAPRASSAGGREADRCSLESDRDIGAFERAHVELARKNLSDLVPPRLAYLLLFGHPTPPERLAFGRAWAAGS